MDNGVHRAQRVEVRLRSYCCYIACETPVGEIPNLQHILWGYADHLGRFGMM